MNKNILGLIIIVIITVVGLWFYLNGTKSESVKNGSVNVQSNMPVPGSAVPESVVSQVSESRTIKEYTVIGTNFSFSPSTIAVDKGDAVKITFKDNDGFHDLRIDGYDIGTQKIQTGGESSVQFVADKTGTFEYYCSVGEHRENGMRGTLTVK